MAKEEEKDEAYKIMYATMLILFVFVFFYLFVTVMDDSDEAVPSS